MDGPECGDGVMTCGDGASSGVWCQEMPQTQNDLVCQYVNCVSCDPVGIDYAVPADGYTGSFETLLFGPLCPVRDDVTYYEKIEALGGASYDYFGAVDNETDYFDYDDPRDYEEWCDWNDPDVAEGYYDPFRPNVEGGFVFPRTAFGVDTETVVAASVLCGAEGVDLPISKLTDLHSDFDFSALQYNKQYMLRVPMITMYKRSLTWIQCVGAVLLLLTNNTRNK